MGSRRPSMTAHIQATRLSLVKTISEDEAKMVGDDELIERRDANGISESEKVTAREREAEERERESPVSGHLPGR